MRARPVRPRRAARLARLSPPAGWQQDAARYAAGKAAVESLVADLRATAQWEDLRPRLGSIAADVLVRVGVKSGAIVAVRVRVGVWDNAATVSCASRVLAARVASALKFSVGEGSLV